MASSLGFEIFRPDRLALSEQSLALPDALYVHVPFCGRRCNYCDFYSCVPEQGQIAEYGKALLNHLDSLICHIQSQAKPSNWVISSLYFGGGTPSLLPAEFYASFIDRLASLAYLAHDLEITMEANPSSFRPNLAGTYRAAGINRLSLGLQTGSNQALKLLGRLHDRETFLASVQAAKEAGFDQITTDLIYGLPGQTALDFEADLDLLFSLDLGHFSAYSLIIAEGTPFYAFYEQGQGQLKLPDLPDEDLERSFYYKLKSRASEAGYEHYEIASWARLGHQSRHNNKYWQLRPYFALGPGATGFYQGVRYTFERDLPAYLDLWQGPSDSDSFSYFRGSELEESLDPETERKDYLLLGFRRMAGISERDYQLRFGRDLQGDFGQELADLKCQGLLEYTNLIWRLTDLGEDFANQVFRAFI